MRWSIMVVVTDWDPTAREVREHFDALGDLEWSRLERDLRSQVSHEIHRRILRRLIQPGWTVLEVGAGAGRFTIELARIGTRVAVTDVSPVQLELNARHVAEARAEHGVLTRELVDVRDLSAFSSGEFDAVVAYGGPLSYAFEAAGQAIGEMLRVIKVGGVVLVSVMSLLGSLRYYLDGVVADIDAVGLPEFARLVLSGDQRRMPGSTHQCHMFRWSELERLLAPFPCSVVASSASNCVSLGDPEALERLHGESDRWETFLDWELAMCAEPGALDGGTHIIFALQKEKR